MEVSVPIRSAQFLGLSRKALVGGGVPTDLQADGDDVFDMRHVRGYGRGASDEPCSFADPRAFRALNVFPYRAIGSNIWTELP